MVEKERLNELFLELVFSVSSDKDELSIVQKSIPLYLRKLNCFVAIVLKRNESDFEEIHTIPYAAKKSKDWQSLILHFTQAKECKNAPCNLNFTNGSYYYGFRLKNYGILILGRKKPFTGTITNELRPIIDHLGEALTQAEEREKKKQAELQRIHLLDKLNKSQSELLKAIEEYKISQEALSYSEAQLRTLIQTLPDLVWLKDIDGFYISCNKSFENFCGLKEDELIGKTDYDIVDRDLAKLFIENDRKAIALGRSTSNEEEITFASDGHNATLDTIKTPMYNNKGKLIGVLGIGHDITAFKETERALRNSEEKYKIITQSSMDIIFVLDKYGNQLFFNDAVFPVLGYTSDELVGKSFTNYVPKSEWKNFYKALGQVFNNKEIKNFNTKIRHKKGHLVDVEINGKLVYQDNKKVGQGTIRDISKRIKAEQEIQLKNELLIKTNAEKDKFFSIVSHDLRSPFNSFLGLSKIMVEELPTLSEKQIKIIASSMLNSATKLYGFLENLLQWATAKQGRIPFKPEFHNLQELINESMLMNLDAAQDKKIKIIFQIPLELKVYADKNIFMSIIRNLVSNAIKFTPKGGKITIASKTIKDNAIKIWISDNGIGMDKKIIENLFQLGIPTNREGTAGEASAGLGLLVCKEFVEMHGGEIWAESNIHNLLKEKGSVFNITFPNK